jgi:hypothetical protein
MHAKVVPQAKHRNGALPPMAKPAKPAIDIERSATP